jgi:hypothetical protein
MSINTREVTKANDDPADEFLHNGEEKVADENNAFVEEDDAEGTERAVRQRTPIKSRWIVPLLRKEITEKPNMSNAEMKHLVSAYVKGTSSLPMLFCRVPGQWQGMKSLEIRQLMSCLPMVLSRK